jgi:hypothetical protein
MSIKYDAAAKVLKFSNQGVKSGSASCTQGWGVGIFDRGMRIADIEYEQPTMSLLDLWLINIPVVTVARISSAYNLMD